MKTLIIVGVLILIIWNLGAGLYYMMVDKDDGKRMARALTRRIALSIALFGATVGGSAVAWRVKHSRGSNSRRRVAAAGV